jgi:hypothetical protein
MPQANTTQDTAENSNTNNPITAFDREEFIKQYNETKAPKQRKIPCTVTGQMITIFGANLHKRVEKFGSVDALLDGFVSRKAAARRNKNTSQQ